MKRMHHVVPVIFLALLLSLPLSSCSARKSFDAAGKNDMATESAPIMDSADAMLGSGFTTDTSTTATSDSSTTDAIGRKIIETIHLSLQTKEFDPLLTSIEKEVLALGGYVETSEVSGRSSDSKQNRYAYLTLRIPAEKSAAFSDFVSENSVIVSRSSNTEDVTLSYVDTASRIKALELEKEALEALLTTAQNVTDIMEIRKNLTDVIHEIETANSTLRTYDNLVSFSTVTISLQEVERTDVVDEQGVFEEIGTNLKNNFEDVWNGAVTVFIFLVSAIPYLILIGLLVLILFLLVFRKRKKKNKTSKEEK